MLFILKSALQFLAVLRILMNRYETCARLRLLFQNASAF